MKDAGDFWPSCNGMWTQGDWLLQILLYRDQTDYTQGRFKLGPKLPSLQLFLLVVMIGRDLALIAQPSEVTLSESPSVSKAQLTIPGEQSAEMIFAECTSPY